MSQARITCPSCKSVLTLKTAIAPGMVLRCPQCRREFGVRGAAPAGPATSQGSSSGFDDPLGLGLPGAALGFPAAGPGFPPTAHPAQPRRTLQPTRPAAKAGGGESNSMWLGIAVGGGLAIAAITLLAIVMMMSQSSSGPEVAANVPVDSSVGSASPQPADLVGAAPAVADTTTSQASALPASAAQVSAAPAPLASAASPPGVPIASTPAASVPPAGIAASPPTPNPQGSATTVNVPGSGAAPVAAAGPALAYRWKAGEEYGYSFSIKVEANGISEESNGMTVLTLSNEPTPAEFAGQNRSGHATGSGFVLSSDGYVMTCAHVVEGATKIEVVISGQSYPGQVVVFDKALDLAVVRLVAANLPVLPLADSDKVEVAQEVRTVGFPLSTVLGDSVKVTRGAIAGRVEGRKVFQIDGSINPGNSGGPVVNEMGQLVGVASSKLASEDIDGVGFAVPSNAVQTLLRSKGVPFQLAEGGARLEGPELARRVTPSVALFKVTIGPGGFGIAKRQVLKYSGNLATKPAAVPGPRRGQAAASPAQSEQGKLLVSELGELIDSTGSVQLPHLLGPLGSLPIEPLPSDGEQTWQTTRVTALTQIIGQESANNQMPSRYRRRRGGGNPFAQRAQVVVVPALEVSAYELHQTSPGRVQLKKKYVFTTLQKEGTPPLAQMTGEGTVMFNSQEGFPESMEFRATMVRSAGAVSVTVPITFAWNRVDQTVLNDARSRAAAGNAAPAVPAGVAAKPAVASTTQEVDRLLRELKTAGNAAQKSVAVNTLVRMQPIDQRRSQVTQAVEPLMRDTNAMLRDGAIRAMGVWGTKDNVPALLKMLDQLDSSIRRSTMEALGKIPDKRGAEAVAKLLPNEADRRDASSALKAMGQVAESEVIGLLKHKDKKVRAEACQVLAEIGGKKSIAALKKMLQSDKDSWSRAAAQLALKKLST